MTSRHLIDPEILPFLEFMPQVGYNAETVPLIRAGITGQLAAFAAADDLPVVSETFTTSGSESGPPVRILAYTPTNLPGPLPALLYIHGGGYIIGAPEMSAANNRKLAAELGCAIFAVNYRLAPENPHPGPVEDCYAALACITQNAAKLNIDPKRIGVKGDSAGGGLAACLALLARDRGEFPLAFQHLIYPMLDDRTLTQSDPHPLTGEFVWTRNDNHFGWSSLLNAEPGSRGISPYAAAARADDLAGLPATFIAVGALDLFMEEDIDYARRLTRAGVAVELHVYPGAFHGFNVMPGSRVAAQAVRDSEAALRRAMHG